MQATAQRNLYLVLFGIGIFPFLINGYVNSVIFRTPSLYWSFELLTWIVMPIIVFMLAALNGGLRFVEIGLHGNVFGNRNYYLLALLCIAFGPLDLFIYEHALALFRAAFPGKPFFSYQAVIPDHGVLRVMVALYFGLTAGIVEEMYFRGLFFKISGFFARPLAVYLIFSPALFALIHWEGALSNVLATYVVGVFTAIAFVVLRNLWPLIVGHIYTDFVWFH